MLGNGDIAAPWCASQKKNCARNTGNPDVHVKPGEELNTGHFPIFINGLIEK
jgi:hypothetical protein